MRIIRAAMTGLAIGLMVSQLRAAWTHLELTDFRVFYESGRAWLAGADLYATTAALPNLNPPHFIVAFAILSWMPVKLALAVWLAVNLACGIAAVALIFRTLEIPCSLVTLQLAFLAAGLCTGVLIALETAQITGVLMIVMTIAWRASRRHEWATCGIALGLLLSIKPFFGCLLLVLLRRRQYAAAACTVVVGAAALAAGAALAGPASMERWIETGRLVTWFQHPANASLLGLLARSGSTSWLWWISLCASAAVISVAFTGPARTLDLEWAAFSLLALLVSPLGWAYYLPVVAGPVVASARARPAVAYAAIGFMWPVPLVAAIVPLTRWSVVSVGSLQSWSMIALWAALLAPAALPQCSPLTFGRRPR